MKIPTRFNIRVYFFLFNDGGDEVLVSDEIIRGNFYTKFPGGGLEFGEGTLACAEREAMEELGQSIKVLSHIYTTDFFVPSLFKEGDQVIAIYYSAQLLGDQKFETNSEKFKFKQLKENEESFRWVALTQLHLENFSFPADHAAAKVFLQTFEKKIL